MKSLLMRGGGLIFVPSINKIKLTDTFSKSLIKKIDAYCLDRILRTGLPYWEPLFDSHVINLEGGKKQHIF